MLTKEEYCENIYNEKYVIPSWIFDVVTFEYNDGLKYYIGLEYNKTWPEDNWFYVLMKVYKDPNYEAPTIYHDVQVFKGYTKRKATEIERRMLIEELYKKNWKVVRKDDDGFVEYKVEKLEKNI